ncbi:hypothetical protein [Flavobacterium lipolyticum]|uniref:Lipoprotein n=1 Tax=Flavobacterium lipolyticum TaxID=2893754 RepID=A0ABS8LV31_9FLAO|nr:hypothetical protein [Flavobacterium sp. F-126]MCC9016445.1 hypothetical protein [Flavobacterium sp. F-126]
MIQITKFFYFRATVFLVLLSLFSCKKEEHQNHVINKEKKTEITDISAKVKNRNNWIFCKAVPLLKDEYVCDVEKFKSLIIDISGDSVFISNKYSDEVYRSRILSESFFEHKYLLRAYQKILKDDFKIILPNKIECIRNKKVYDKNSELDKYFQDAFFVDNYMFVESDGCVIAFAKSSKDKKSAAECEDVAVEMGSGKVCTIKNTSLAKVYEEIISSKLVEKSSVLPKRIPMVDSIMNINKNGLIDVKFKVKSGKIEVVMNFDGGVTEIILEKEEKNIKRSIYYYAD